MDNTTEGTVMARRSWLVIGSGSLLGVVAVLALGVAGASGDTTGPPVLTVGPVVKGAPGVAKTLRTTDGTWSTSATFTYQWLRCVKGYKGCANLPGEVTYTVIPGATAVTYTPVTADVGHVLVAQVTATNAAGSTSVLSNGDGPVEARPPWAKEKPWIRGTKRVGQRIYVNGPGWTRSPYMFRYQWLRCSADGNACIPITGKRKQCYPGSCIRVSIGTDSQYMLTRKDVGHRIRIRATAWNGAGRGTSTSNPTRVIRR
jgi:hypothetical protein